MRACGSAWIEAELGALPGDEDVYTNALPSQTMTDPRQAREFVERTGIDALAVAVGNVHGPDLGHDPALISAAWL